MNPNKKVYLAPRNIQELIAPTGNIYESTVIITKRAKHIAMQMKEELDAKLEDYITGSEERDSIDAHRQYEITQYYEKLPKPVLEATREFLEGNIAFRYIQEEK
ncbi:DNA-directed RNA polymerase subunit omega [Cardinium endosymbiont of Tipula unca]|uniref:DNA-directed RNA polymerase subunit omega n=1 Tax=Cardinium endosymbiont of Tipula unca TaxID=3066216 RepID=UPI0030D3B49C